MSNGHKVMTFLADSKIGSRSYKNSLLCAIVLQYCNYMPQSSAEIENQLIRESTRTPYIGMNRIPHRVIHQPYLAPEPTLRANFERLIPELKVVSTATQGLTIHKWA